MPLSKVEPLCCAIRIHLKRCGPLAWIISAGSSDRREIKRFVEVRVWHSLKQGSGVGMRWVGKKLLPRCDLDQASSMHHCYPVRDVIDHRKVVGDEKIREAELRLEVFQQVQDLRLNRYIQR